MKADKTRFYLEYDFVCLYEDKILYEDKAKLYIDLSSDLKKDEFKDIDATEEEKTNIVCYDIDDKQKFKEDFKANKTIELKPFVGNNVIGDLNVFLKKRKDMIVITCMYDGNPIEFIGSGIFSQEIDTQIFTKVLANGNIILKANAYSDMSNIIKTVIKDFDEAKFGVQIILYGYDVKNYTNNPNITEYIYI